MKKLFVLSASFVLMVNIFSQQYDKTVKRRSFGFNAGTNISFKMNQTFEPNIAKTYGFDSSYKPNIAYTFGFDYNYYFSEKVSLQTGISRSRYTIIWHPNYYPDSYRRYDYYNIPIGVSYNKNKFSFNAGLSVNFLISTGQKEEGMDYWLKGYTPIHSLRNYSAEYTFKYIGHWTDFSYNIGLGYTFYENNNKKLQLIFPRITLHPLGGGPSFYRTKLFIIESKLALSFI